MKHAMLYLWMLVIVISSLAQNASEDSLLKALPASHDSARVDLLNALAGKQWSEFSILTKEKTILARSYAMQAYALSRELNYHRGIGKSLFNLGNIIAYSFNYGGTFSHAIDTLRLAMPYLIETGQQHTVGSCMSSMGNFYHMVGNMDKAILYLDSGSRLLQQTGDTTGSLFPYANLGHCYFDIGNYQKAYELGMAAYKFSERMRDTLFLIYTIDHLSNLYLGAGLPETSIGYTHHIFQLYPDVLNIRRDRNNIPLIVQWGMILGGEAFLKNAQPDSAKWIAGLLPDDSTSYDNIMFRGHIAAADKRYGAALTYFKRGYEMSRYSGHTIGIAKNANEISEVFLNLKMTDSAEKYAELAYVLSKGMHALLEWKMATGLFYDISVLERNFEKSYEYSKLYKLLGDSLAPEEYKRKLFLVQVQNELELQKQQALLLAKDNKIQVQQLERDAMLKKILAVSAAALLFISVMIIRNNRQKQKANVLLNTQKKTIEETLKELKSTQAQLIQSEKMASLGELTSGIAHELQNPLNFVNNFSEVNAEMMEEMINEIKNGNTTYALDIAAMIEKNLNKIKHHGKRAGDIVKSMLQHSRSTRGKMEPTDINALVDENLRLSLDSFRVNNNEFRIMTVTNLDQQAGYLNVVPGDLGRVLLNIFQNAFWALAKKKKEAGESFEPRLDVSTKRENGNLEIHIRDNGGGIPEKITSRIFQPFFTTKPTGQGTGLGLSLSYDIIKTYNGELLLESREGDFAEFIIRLPA